MRVLRVLPALPRVRLVVVVRADALARLRPPHEHAAVLRGREEEVALQIVLYARDSAFVAEEGDRALEEGENGWKHGDHGQKLNAHMIMK